MKSRPATSGTPIVFSSPGETNLNERSAGILLCSSFLSAAKIANSPGASSRGGKKSGSGGDSSQGGTTAPKKAAGRKGGKATARKS